MIRIRPSLLAGALVLALPVVAHASLSFSLDPEISLDPFRVGSPENIYQLNLRTDPADAGRMTVTGKNGIENHTVAFSTGDAGATWSFTRQLNSGDPDNIYAAADGTVHWTFIDSTGSATNNRIGYRRSTDHGLTWSPGTIISTTTLDHPHLVEDRSPSSPWHGSLYLGGRRFNSRSLGILRSRDGGATWQETLFDPGAAVGQGFVHHPAVLADGPLIIPVKSQIRIYTDAGGAYAGSNIELYVFRSTDGGLSFGPPIYVNNANNLAGAGPGAARAFSGVHVVPWAGGERLVLVSNRPRVGQPSVLEICTSDDGGLTWSAPRTVRAPSPANYGSGSMGVMVSPDGVLGIQYYNQVNSPSRFHLFFTASIDAGQTWSTPLQVSTAISYEPSSGLQPREADGDQVYGDAAADGSFRLVWTDNRANDNIYRPMIRRVVPIITLPPLTSAPTGLAVAAEALGARLTWGTVPHATAYEVQTRSTGDSSWSRLGGTEAATLSWLDTGLLPGASRDYRVRAHHVLGASPWSEVVTHTQPVPPLPTPTARWRFDENAGASAAESGGAAALALALTGSPSWTTEGRIEGALELSRATSLAARQTTPYLMARASSRSPSGSIPPCSTARRVSSSRSGRAPPPPRPTRCFSTPATA